ncbi:carbon-nitrogen hydrolase family protein [Pseudodonghicola xiamenensis]|uniref:Carbon-nitrogen hydrolase n=1 Tax=Pseudodonghicola xiamenensis TaxID=337702 RepID=A0A8J3MCV4_9RHOB|nr:carbon-nitrogen hydrolase family protein [Pseudodonghicola xiamenensis]GHG94154.1 carbon-nitrogen hydrolase [Pseudodonghicola xiamenensis]
MKLALLQTPPANGNADQALAELETAMTAAASAGADLLVTPELLLPGYNCPDLHAAEAQPVEADWIARLSALAATHRCGLVVGWAERAGDTIYNSASAIGPDGALLATYRKRQLFGPMERASFVAGCDPAPVFDLAGRRCGLQICYDIEFPEHARDLARRGAELILVPTANPVGFEHVQRLFVPARAAENAICVAYANYCGEENGLEFGGMSVVAGPDGAEIVRAGRGPALLIADLPVLGDYPAGMLSTQLDDLVGGA